MNSISSKQRLSLRAAIGRYWLYLACIFLAPFFAVAVGNVFPKPLDSIPIYVASYAAWWRYIIGDAPASFGWVGMGVLAAGAAIGIALIKL